jgi:hypothetical protein
LRKQIPYQMVPTFAKLLVNNDKKLKNHVAYGFAERIIATGPFGLTTTPRDIKYKTQNDPTFCHNTNYVQNKCCS